MRRIEFDHLELLERRVLLAGSVSVDVNQAGDLVIVGDREANEIRIESTGEPGAFRIIGENTSVEGESSIVAEGVTGGMKIRLKGGDDSVTIRPGDDLIDTFEDQPSIPFQLADELFVNTGAGDDVIDISGFAIVAPEISSASAQNVNAMQLDDVRVMSKYGDDSVYINNAFIQGNVEVRTKTGDDFVEISHLQMGEGECEVIVRACSGSDTICMYEIGGEGNILVAAGGSRDTMVGAELLPDSVVYRSVETFEFKFEEE